MDHFADTRRFGVVFPHGLELIGTPCGKGLDLSSLHSVASTLDIAWIGYQPV